MGHLVAKCGAICPRLRAREHKEALKSRLCIVRLLYAGGYAAMSPVRPDLATQINNIEKRLREHKKLTHFA